MLHCHIYILHVLVLFSFVLTVSAPSIQLPPILPFPYVAYRLVSRVVHLLPSPRNLFAVSVLPCYPKEMRCVWSRHIISNDFSHGEYPHSFALQLGNWNYLFFNILVSVGRASTITLYNTRLNIQYNKDTYLLRGALKRFVTGKFFTVRGC